MPLPSRELRRELLEDGALGRGALSKGLEKHSRAERDPVLDLEGEEIHGKLGEQLTERSHTV